MLVRLAHAGSTPAKTTEDPPTERCGGFFVRACYDDRMRSDEDYIGLFNMWGVELRGTVYQTVAHLCRERVGLQRLADLEIAVQSATDALSAAAKARYVGDYKVARGHLADAVQALEAVAERPAVADPPGDGQPRR
jgi:hypothetical protein